MDIQTATPAEIDTILAKLYVEKLRILQPVAHRNEVKVSIRKYQAYGAVPKYLIERLEKAEICAKVALADALAFEEKHEAPLNAEFVRRGGWSRFFVVTGGHLHKRGCGTLRPSTLIGWLPADSGKDEDAVVGSYGTIACTHCFPSAPVAGTPVAKPGHCNETRFVDGSDPRRVYRYGTCYACGTRAAITKGGNLRKHKIAFPVR